MSMKGVADYQWNRPFYQFLIDNYIVEDSPIGDLARDARADKWFPRKACGEDTIREYLEEKDAGYEVIEAFEEAFEAYKEDRWQLKREDDAAK